MPTPFRLIPRSTQFFVITLNPFLPLRLSVGKSGIYPACIVLFMSVNWDLRK